MAVVVTLPWTQQRWALPFLCVLATTPEVSEKLGTRHKTVGMRARQMVSLLRRWLPTVPIKLIGDTAYSILELELHCVAQHNEDDGKNCRGCRINLYWAFQHYEELATIRAANRLAPSTQ